MIEILENEKKASHTVTPLLAGIVLVSVASYFLLIGTPILAYLPVSITEEVEVLAVTEKGIVFETSTGVAVVTDRYQGEPGDVIEITYSVPMKYLEEKNRQQARWDAFHLDP